MILLIAAAALASQPGNSTTQPQPPRVVSPGAMTPVAPPSDAVVLFAGESLAEWSRADGSDAGWKVEDGSMVVAAGAGNILSRRRFGDAQVHVEFMIPVVAGEGQDRGNSGVYIQGRYEVQVLDSYQNQTYPNGQCGAIYGQHAPLVNASRPPGQWQTFDIIYRAPSFDDGGKRSVPATMTVLHNGVLIHNHVSLEGPTGGSMSPESAEAGPILLQDHAHPVRYRNIWVRPL